MGSPRGTTPAQCAQVVEQGQDGMSEAEGPSSGGREMWDMALKVDSLSSL